jgi:diketogulonate reductase-like aldo/keto reductase
VAPCAAVAMIVGMDAHQPRAILVERNPDGSLTKETLQRALKALKKRLKVSRLDDESRLGHDPMSKGGKSTITGVKPPEQYPAEVWNALEQKGRIRSIGHGLYEVVDLGGAE